jgi:5-methylcytosine-specific restriction endonuclease McrA
MNQELRQQVLERDKHICQNCNKSFSYLQIHHKIPHNEGVFASSPSEDYQMGRDDACANRVVLGPHTSGYERGYADGRAACFGGISGNIV